MAASKYNKSEPLDHIIGVRVSKNSFDKLEKQRTQSNARTIGEFARSILLKEKIIFYHKNAELESVALELAVVRKELNAMGRNINQITRHFHTADNAGQKMFQAMKAADEYKKVSAKADQLMKMIGDISKKWLQK